MKKTLHEDINSSPFRVYRIFHQDDPSIVKYGYTQQHLAEELIKYRQNHQNMELQIECIKEFPPKEFNKAIEFFSSLKKKNKIINLPQTNLDDLLRKLEEKINNYSNLILDIN